MNAATPLEPSPTVQVIDANFSLEELKRIFDRQKINTTHEDLGDTSSRVFGCLFVLLGASALFLNSLLLLAMARRRSHLAAHVFYILISNFAFIDSIKGACSILFAVKLLSSNELGDRNMQLDQICVLLLRFTNIVTIINLMMITLNEYIYISSPLRYSDVVTRRRVISVVVCTWFAAGCAVLLNSLLATENTVFLDQECFHEHKKSLGECTRHVSHSPLAPYIFHLGVVAFCLACLVMTMSLYAALMKIISKLLNAEMRLKAEMECLRSSEDTNGNALEVGKDGHRGSSQGSGGGGANARRRHKYAVLIGSVLAVYTIYLINYAVIQLLHVLSVSTNDPSAFRLNMIRNVCYTFVFLHSLLQPLCYFRMREFRLLIQRSLCGRRRCSAAQFAETSMSNGGTKRHSTRPEAL